MKRITLMTITALVMFTASSHALVFYAYNASIKQVPEGYLYANGETAEYINIPQDGTYQVAALALGTPCAGVWPLMAVSLDGFPRETVTVGTSTMQVYSFNVALTAGVHTIGMALLNNMASGGEDINLYLNAMAVYAPPGVADPTISNQSAWLNAMQTLEANLLANTASAIDTFRKGDVTIVVKDEAGNVVSGAAVSVEQTNHDFLFGANFCGYQTFDTAEKNALYEQRFKELFNYATVPFYWSLIEPVQGQPDYARTDSMVNWCVANAIRVKGHALLWAYELALPAWTNGIPSTSVQQAHVAQIMQRYLGLISNWEVVNEPINAPGFAVNQPYAWARAIDSTGTLILNEYGHFYNGFQDCYDGLNSELAGGTPIDAAGMQAHAPVDMAFPLEHVQYTLNKYAALNTPIHITEFTPGSNGNAVLRSTWRGTWTEGQQAEYAEDFYRICFAHPSVEAISWWDVCDLNAWVSGGGVLRADLSAKPVYNTLKSLIHTEWHTNAQGSSASNGSYGFRAFYGTYLVTVQYNGESKQVDVHVKKGEANNFVVTVAVPSAAPPAVTVNSLLTKSTKPTLTGTFSNAAQVQVSVNGSTWYNATLSGTAWSLTWPVTLAAGTYNVQAKAQDASGNMVIDATTNELTIDTTVPVITLLGSSSMSIKRYRAFIDPGATATDNVSGDLTVEIVRTGTVKTSTLGTYYLYYNVKDVAGNAAAKKTRIVKVVR
ncbi:MAG TPA: endo-1,4-beta-xylanase [Candidatus Hydrogenedentes bacterium]|nr:endo-1,4-beta-xylanase [Candidatus Hydrogenedentota bacterium]